MTPIERERRNVWLGVVAVVILFAYAVLWLGGCVPPFRPRWIS